MEDQEFEERFRRYIRRERIETAVIIILIIIICSAGFYFAYRFIG